MDNDIKDKQPDVVTKDSLLLNLKEMKEALEQKLKEDVKGEVIETLKDKMEAIDSMNAQIKELKDNATNPEILSKLREDMNTTIKAFDLLQTRIKSNKIVEPKAKSLGEALKEKMEEYGVKFSGEKGDGGSGGEIEKILKVKSGSIVIPLGRINLKTDMTLANTLTGDQVATYNPLQALVPGQSVNFRDLMPTVVSPTGLYVTYRENTGEVNNIAKQTEGNEKGVNNYDFTEIKTVTSSVAGVARFTKQLLKFLPFMQNTLVRALMRDFYKAENAQFFTTVSGAATGSTSGGTNSDNVKQLVNIIGALKDANFTPSYILVSNTIMGSLIISTYTTGYYSGAGSVAVSQGGVISIWGVPIIAASWVTGNHALVIDNNYLERVETESLNIAFSFDDANNFTQNKVTARIECMEEVNFMRAESASYIDLGAS